MLRCVFLHNPPLSGCVLHSVVPEYACFRHLNTVDIVFNNRDYTVNQNNRDYDYDFCHNAHADMFSDQMERSVSRSLQCQQVHAALCMKCVCFYFSSQRDRQYCPSVSLELNCAELTPS